MKSKFSDAAILYFWDVWIEFLFCFSQVRLGKNGVEEVMGLGALSDFEKEGLEKMKPELKSSIEKGIKFANEN